MGGSRQYCISSRLEIFKGYCMAYAMRVTFEEQKFEYKFVLVE